MFGYPLTTVGGYMLVIDIGVFFGACLSFAYLLRMMRTYSISGLPDLVIETMIWGWKTNLKLVLGSTCGYWYLIFLHWKGGLLDALGPGLPTYVTGWRPFVAETLLVIFAISWKRWNDRKRKRVVASKARPKPRLHGTVTLVRS